MHYNACCRRFLVNTCIILRVLGDEKIENVSFCVLKMSERRWIRLSVGRSKSARPVPKFRDRDDVKPAISFADMIEKPGRRPPDFQCFRPYRFISFSRGMVRSLPLRICSDLRSAM